MSIPKKHHFLPEFFLKKWCNLESSQLVYFHRPYGSKLVDETKFPSQVGFEKFLYSIKNLPVDQAQEIEVNFFSKIDDRAAKALEVLHQSINISDEIEEHWWRFVVTLIARMPSDLAKLIDVNDRISTNILPILGKVSSIPEFADKEEEIRLASIEVRQQRKDTTIRLLSEFMNKEKLLNNFRSFHWNIISTEGAKHELMTSDRPAHFGKEANALMLLIPIGPHLLFVASNDKKTSLQLGRSKVNQLVAEVNKLTVGNATEYVFARTNAQKLFISKHMGSLKHPSFTDQLFKNIDTMTQPMAEALDDSVQEHIFDL